VEPRSLAGGRSFWDAKDGSEAKQGSQSARGAVELNAAEEWRSGALPHAGETHSAGTASRGSRVAGPQASIWNAVWACRAQKPFGSIKRHNLTAVDAVVIALMWGLPLVAAWRTRKTEFARELRRLLQHKRRNESQCASTKEDMWGLFC